jgi:hypothetical protein
MTIPHYIKNVFAMAILNSGYYHPLNAHAWGTDKKIYLG